MTGARWLEFEVPKPPSANNLYGTGPFRERHVTKAYKAWRHEAGHTVMLALPKPMPTFVRVEMEVDVPGKMDLDNALAAIFDLIQFPTGIGLIGNDKDVVKCCVRRVAPDPRWLVRLREAT